MTADLASRAKNPAMHAEEERWTAAGRQIGRFRIYFDGIRGGQETTFGQDAINDGSANVEARREKDFRYLLNLQRLYSNIQLASVSLGGEDAYVMDLMPTTGKPTKLYVSVQTALVMRRDTEDRSITFEDYRPVDGEQVPFLTTIRDALGETTIRVRDVHFNVDIPDALFAPQKSKAP